MYPYVRKLTSDTSLSITPSLEKIRKNLLYSTKYVINIYRGRLSILAYVFIYYRNSNYIPIPLCTGVWTSLVTGTSSRLVFFKQPFNTANFTWWETYINLLFIFKAASSTVTKILWAPIRIHQGTCGYSKRRVTEITDLLFKNILFLITMKYYVYIATNLEKCQKIRRH